MGVEFDDEEDFRDICQELDPMTTGLVQFDDLIEKLKDDQSEQQKMDMIEDMERESGIYE